MKAVGLLLAFGLLASPEKVINFDREPLGAPPTGWSAVTVNGSANSQWEIRRDRSVPTAPAVLARVPADANADHPSLAILNSMSLRDGDVSVRVKPVSGSRMRAGGVVFRYRDANNYYFARADALEQNVALFRVENGQRVRLGMAVKHDLPPDAWRILKVTARGNNLQVYLDHRRIVQARDSGFTGSGKVGLWTAGDSTTYFYDFRVNPK